MKNAIKHRLGHEIKRGAGSHTDRSKVIDNDAAIEEGIEEMNEQFGKAGSLTKLLEWVESDLERIAECVRQMVVEEVGEYDENNPITSYMLYDPDKPVEAQRDFLDWAVAVYDEEHGNE